MSTVIVNTLTGTTTAGSISVTGEGNSTTTNLQQGLLKSWVDIPADGASLNDSFNIGSSTDSGAGDRRVATTGFDAEVCIASSSSNRQNYDIESYYMIAGDLA
jgi:hypothetical protein